MIPLLVVFALSMSTTVARIGMHDSSGYVPCRRFALPATDRPSVGIWTIRSCMRLGIFSCFLLDGPVSDKFRWAYDRLATQIRVWQTRWRLTQLRNVKIQCHKKMVPPCFLIIWNSSLLFHCYLKLKKQRTMSQVPLWQGLDMWLPTSILRYFSLPSWGE
jgi:hypothetical protein